MEANELKFEPMVEGELLELIGQTKHRMTEVEKTHPGEPKMFDDHKLFQEELIARLLEERDRFRNIFKTEHGSIYFVLQDGKSFRIKRLKYGYVIEPIADRIVFVNSENEDSSFGIGVTPCETWEETMLQHRGHKVVEIIK